MNRHKQGEDNKRWRTPSFPPHLAEELWVVLHLGEGVKDVGEEHHGEALLLL